MFDRRIVAYSCGGSPSLSLGSLNQRNFPTMRYFWTPRQVFQNGEFCSAFRALSEWDSLIRVVHDVRFRKSLCVGSLAGLLLTSPCNACPRAHEKISSRNIAT